MSVPDIVMIGLLILVLSSSAWPLFWQGVMVVASALLRIYTHPLPIIDAAMIYIPVNLAGVVMGLAIHARWRGSNGLLFFWLAVCALMIHVVMLIPLAAYGYVPPPKSDFELWCKCFLNIIFALTAISVGGRGFAHTYRHCSLFSLAHNRVSALRNHGQ
jgi:hypothetical protein